MKGPYDDRLEQSGHWPSRGRFNIELLDQLNDNNHTDYIIFDGISSDQTNRVKEEGRAPRGWRNHLFTSHWTILSSN